MCVRACVSACVCVNISVSCRFFQNALDFFCFLFYGLRRKDKQVIAILVTLSKVLITQKPLLLELFLEICYSATLSLAIRWYIVWGSIACHK